MNGKAHFMSRGFAGLLAGVALAGSLALFAGCPSQTNEQTSTLPPAYSRMIGGAVNGGQQPVEGAAVTLYAAGTAGAGSAVQEGGTATSDANGRWSINDFTCPAPTAQMYIVASGGNPGFAPGTDNTAIVLIAALGSCDSLPVNVNVNEITTVAAGYALNGFISLGPLDISRSSTNQTGLVNAMATAALLADVTTGLDGPAFDGEPAATQQKFNSLANSLAACVNTTSSTSSQCEELFACGLPGSSYDVGTHTCTGGSGTLATNTLMALSGIARKSGQVNMAGIYDVAIRNVVFSPALTTAPNDETLVLNFDGGGISDPVGIAIDADGNVWTASHGNNSVNELDAFGNSLSPPFIGYDGGGVSYPEGIAIDTTGDVWTASPGNNTINEFVGGSTPVTPCPDTPLSGETGCPLSPTSGYTDGGLSSPFGIAVDVAGNVWTTSAIFQGSSTVHEFGPGGTPVSGGGGYTGGGLDIPYGIAIDVSGNVWTASYHNSTVNEFSANGTPISPSSGYLGGGLQFPSGLGTAVGPMGNVWTASNYNSTINEFVGGSTPPSSCPATPGSSDTGCPLSPAGGYTGGGLNYPSGIAIDAAGNVWVTNDHNAGDSSSADTISEFSASGTALSPATGYLLGGNYDPNGIAIDAAGNVWVANSRKGFVTEMIGAAAPTRTPLVDAIAQGFTP